MKLSFGGITPAAALASVWLLSSGLALLANGLSIDAWLVDALQAPQVVMYDDASGSILYSLCNSSGTPVFPGDSSAAFDLKFPPLNGTGVAGFGYWEKDNGVVVSCLPAIYTYLGKPIYYVVLISMCVCLCVCDLGAILLPNR